MIKRIFLLIIIAALCIPLTAYTASDSDESGLGFLDDWNGLTSTKNQYFFLTDETVAVENKEVEKSPDYAYIYAGAAIYVPVAVYQNGAKDYVRATDKMIKTDNVSVSSKVINGKAYVGDIELVDSKKLKLSDMEAGIYARIPLASDYSSSSRTLITLRLVLSVQDVTYNDTQVTFKCKLANRTTEIDKNSVYGAKTPTQFKVRKNYHGEATFDFGNNIKYTVRVKGNSTYYMNLSRQEDPAIKEMYPGAFLDFYNFLGTRDTFTSTGTLKIPVKRSSLAKKGESESLYVYRIDGDTLTSLGSGVVSYDSKTETLSIKTKSLQNYVLTNQALKKNVSESANDILKSGYAAVSEASTSEIAGSSTAKSSSQSSAAAAVSAVQEDADGYVPEESAASYSPANNVNDNVDTGGYINASNKSTDNPQTSDPAVVPAFAAMLAGGILALVSLRRVGLSSSSTD